MTPSFRSSACRDIVVENVLVDAIGLEREKAERNGLANIRRKSTKGMLREREMQESEPWHFSEDSDPT